MKILAPITENQDIASKKYVDDNSGGGGGGSATDVQVNGTSITSSGVANLITNTAYNASTNKLATMSDIPSDVEQKHAYTYSGKTYYYQFYGVSSINDITVNIGTEVDVIYATLYLINLTITQMQSSYSGVLTAIQGIHIPNDAYQEPVMIINIHNLGCMTCYIDPSTKYVTQAIFTNFSQGYSVNFGANPNALTIYYSAQKEVEWIECNVNINNGPSFSNWVTQNVLSVISNANSNNISVLLKANIIYDYEGTPINVGTWYMSQAQNMDSDILFQTLIGENGYYIIQFDQSNVNNPKNGLYVPFMLTEEMLPSMPYIADATSSDIVDKFNQLLAWLRTTNFIEPEED